MCSFLGQLNVCYSNFKSKRYEIYPLLYIFLFFFIACKENKTDIIPCVPQTKVDVPLEEVSGISSSFIDTVLFVKLQEPQNTFRNLNKLKIYGDTIYILDERLSKLMSFDKEEFYHAVW